MSEASFASLNPALLARKGGAKPAMRPQLTNLPDAGKPQNLEDLGWNDMGQDDEHDAEKQSAQVVQLTPAQPNDADTEEPDDTPDVVRQQEELAARIADADESDDDTITVETLSPMTAKKNAKRSSKSKASKAKSSSGGRRAAFTLRLDPTRHLKLRLASTMQGISAQALVTDALDAVLEQIDDLDTLAEKMQRD